jgi:hypothetical protein
MAYGNDLTGYFNTDINTDTVVLPVPSRQGELFSLAGPGAWGSLILYSSLNARGFLSREVETRQRMRWGPMFDEQSPWVYWVRVVPWPWYCGTWYSTDRQ